MCKKILIVGGTFDRKEGKASGLMARFADAVLAALKNKAEITFINGGNISTLQMTLEHLAKMPQDYVFWFANVSNDEEKIRDVKAIAPHVMLVTSKRNDMVDREKKYNFEELLQRALNIKANLCFEFSKSTSGLFNIRVFDPLGCVWYDGLDIKEAAKACLDRLDYLSFVTRKPSIQVDSASEFAFNENDRKFLDIVHKSADTFHKLMCLPPDVKRFVGNASLRFKSPTRCMSGFPAIRKDNLVLISRRNVDKTGISEKDFVACALDDSGSVAYTGDNKPSVDSPVQLRLFKALPNIDYILHGHCYIEDAPFTDMAIPCGAVEEADAVTGLIEKHYGGCDKTYYAINLRGHGCLVMANTAELDRMGSVQFYVRPIPEMMNA